MENTLREANIGLLLLGAERFCPLGEGTQRGSYSERKQAEAAWMLKDCQEIGQVCFPGIVFTQHDMINAIDQFTRAKVDMVLAVYLSWAEDAAWSRFLRDMPPVPVLFAHRMRDSISLSDTHDPDQFTEYLCCGGLVGMLEASGNNRAMERPMLFTCLGTWQQILERTRVFAISARARALMRQGVIGLLGGYNEAMWSTYVHPYDVFRVMGPELRFFTISELCDAIEDIPVSEAAAAMRRIAKQYEVLPNVREDKFLASVRASMGLERVARQHRLDLMVLNDINTQLFKQVGLRPGFCPTSQEISALFVPEGDVGAGLAVYILKLLSGGHVHFIEPFHVDLPGQNFAAGHAGPNDYTDPEGSTKISIDVRFAASGWKHAGAPFAWHVFSPGIKTMLHCSYKQGRFILVATLVESLPCRHFLATYSHGLFRPVGQNSQELFGKLLEIGVTQHYGIARGDHREALKDLAGMLGVDYQAI